MNDASWNGEMDADKTNKEKAKWEQYENARTMLNKSYKQHSAKNYLYSHLPTISKTIQVKLTRHVGHS